MTRSRRGKSEVQCCAKLFVTAEMLEVFGETRDD